MPEPLTPEEFAEEERSPDDDEVHFLLDAVAELGYYAVLGSLLLAFFGLGAVAMDVRPLGDAAIAVAITVGTASMVVAAVVGILSGAVSLPGGD